MGVSDGMLSLRIELQTWGYEAVSERAVGRLSNQVLTEMPAEVACRAE